MSINYAHIEAEARRLQVEAWTGRAVRYQVSNPPILQVLSPENVAEYHGLSYELCDRLEASAGDAKYKTAGVFDRGRGIISVSSEFSYEVRRFTGAHELGHFVLHGSLGFLRPHRDRPVSDSLGGGRSQIEREADYFAGCFLAPERLVVEEFRKRFGRIPLVLDETLAFHLRGKQAGLLLASPPRSLDFAAAVAGASILDGRPFPSMAKHFGMSITAMAVRIRELGLVAEV